MLDDAGRLTTHWIAVAAQAPAGPEQDCGWRIGTAPVTIDLDGTAFANTWWVHSATWRRGTTPWR